MKCSSTDGFEILIAVAVMSSIFWKWRRAVQYKVADILEECTSSNLKVNAKAKKETR